MKLANDYINEWGRKKYPEYATATFTLEVEKGSDGYCENCYSEYAYISVRANYKEIDELRNMELSTLLNEILGAQ